METIKHEDFSIASSTFAMQAKVKFSEGIYNNTDELLEWSVLVTKESLSISDDCGSAHVALTLSDMLSKLEDENHFQKIIERCSELGIKSEVRTESEKYTAAVVISMYIDSKLV